MANAIITENLNVGTTAWKVTNGQIAEIQGYCDKCSYNPGDTVTFFVSTAVAATSYSITIFRMGWYSGAGASQKTQISGLSGQAQGIWNNTTHTLSNCPTAITDSTTLNLETGWTSSATWSIPNNAVTGVYVALFQDTNGKQSCCTFVVKSTSPADYVYVLDHTTSCAYNAWGGNSLYAFNSNGGSGLLAATKDSFNRPDINGYGTGNLFRFDICLIKWLEQQGYSINYISNIDLHTNAAQLLSYKAYLSGCHDEYWTKAMRDGVEAAIAGGVSAAFLGANTCYWQARLENDNAGHANRTLVCYRSTSTDPQYNINNAIVTVRWRDTPVSRPENTMLGIMYSSDTSGSNAAWTVDPSADQTYFAGTGFVLGQSYGSDLIGYEWDKIQAGGPSNLKTIGTSTITGGTISPDTSNTTWYRAASGALVFASGSVGWTQALDTYRFPNFGGGAMTPGIQTLLANIMGAFKGPVWRGF